MRNKISKRHLYLSVALILITFIYGLFQARMLITGPSLTVTSPREGATLQESITTVSGTAQHVSRVTLNGRVIATDPYGSFSETLATPVGYGVLVVTAEDRFGRSKEQRITFLGAPPSPATSTSQKVREVSYYYPSALTYPH